MAKKSDADDAKPDAVRKDWRGLGAKACIALQSMKLENVTILATKDALKSNDYFGVFMNSVRLSNYENCFKKEKEIDGGDPRLAKVTKNIGTIDFETESAGVLESEEVKFQEACAKSTNLARHCANTRGSVADPEWMEQQVRKLIAGNDKCTLEVLDATKL